MQSDTDPEPGNPENEPFVKWLTDVASAGDDVPSLFSISYGDEETGVSYAYAQRCAVEFQKAGVRGISLLAASGDAGVGCGTAGFIPGTPSFLEPIVRAVRGATLEEVAEELPRGLVWTNRRLTRNICISSG